MYFQKQPFLPIFYLAQKLRTSLRAQPLLLKSQHPQAQSEPPYPTYYRKTRILT
jgi:hypothetical protein